MSKLPIKIAIKRARSQYFLASSAARGLRDSKADRAVIIKARIQSGQAYLELLELRLKQAEGVGEMPV